MRRLLFFSIFIAVIAIMASTQSAWADGAFSTDHDDWHSIVVDLESSALVRIYGKIVSDILPTDIYIGVSEYMSSVVTWLGDSEGNEPKPETDDIYLVIEGQAPSAELASEISVDYVCYKMGDTRMIQSIGVPVLGRASAQPQEDNGGCSAGFSGALLFCGVILSAIHRKTKRP